MRSAEHDCSARNRDISAAEDSIAASAAAMASATDGCLRWFAAEVRGYLGTFCWGGEGGAVAVPTSVIERLWAGRRVVTLGELGR